MKICMSSPNYRAEFIVNRHRCQDVDSLQALQIHSAISKPFPRASDVATHVSQRWVTDLLPETDIVSGGNSAPLWH